MPRLPSADQLGQRPTPSARGGIAQLNLTTPRRGQEAQALAQFGQSVAGLGDTMAKLALKEKLQLDEARREEAFTNYQTGLMQFELDPEQGFANILTGDAVKRPLKEEFDKKREALRTEIRKGLANDDQRAGFDMRAQVADRQFDARLYKHVADQSRAYQGIVSEGLQATERRMAALNWSQPGQIEMSILRTSKEIERKARMDGLDPARPEDREVIDTLKIIAETRIHSDVVEQMILSGQDSAASAYYQQMKDRLTPEAMIILGSKVDAASVDGTAIRGADLVWGMLGPKGPNDPVRLDTMERWLRDRYSEDPRALKAAISDLRSRAVAHDDEQRELNASYKAKVLDAYHQGAGIKDLQRMPEYWALNGTERSNLRDYVDNSGWTAQQRARAEAGYLEGAKAANGFGAFWELSNPRVLSTISETQILALEPELGRTLTEDLMKAKRKLDSPGKVHAASIDAELFNVLAVEAGFDPYSSAKSDEAKEQLGRLKNEVEKAIDTAQEAKKAPLGRKEKEELMRSIIDQRVMVDDWGSDTSVPAAALMPSQRQYKVYVPIADIDQEWMVSAINYMRSVGAIPGEWTDSKAQQAMKGRLERAYAHSITGGSSAEERAILEGE